MFKKENTKKRSENETKEAKTNVKLPFSVLELNQNPKVDQKTQMVTIDLKRRWNFLQLFDFITPHK